MNKFVLVMLIIMSWMHAFAANIDALLPIKIDLQNTEKLQRGATFFMNYCSGCHALRYLRYNRMARDLGLTTFSGEIDTDLLVNNLIFTSAKMADPIQVSMPEEDALQWFGRVPPDLSLSARERGPEWIYTYLKSFYVDKTRPFGANNLIMPDVAMPNVLAPLGGIVIAKYTNNTHQKLPSALVLVEPGEMNQQQFDSALKDLVTFLVYVAEPVKLVRYQFGVVVIVFLCIFLVVAYRLKKNYWKNVQ